MGVRGKRGGGGGGGRGIGKQYEPRSDQSSQNAVSDQNLYSLPKRDATYNHKTSYNSFCLTAF